MKFIDEYRQGDIAKKLAQQIASMTDRPLKLMEVCGGHTHTIFKYGIEDLLPPNIGMISWARLSRLRDTAGPRRRCDVDCAKR